MLGVQLPEGIDPAVLLRALPEEVEQHSTKRALLGLAAPLALMAAGYGWMWYMHSITPLWQQLLCWLAVGTGYVGLFQVAHECGRNAFLPNNPVTQVGGRAKSKPAASCTAGPYACAGPGRMVWQAVAAWWAVTAVVRGARGGLTADIVPQHESTAQALERESFLLSHAHTGHPGRLAHGPLTLLV